MPDPQWTITYSRIPWNEPAGAWRDASMRRETDWACCDQYWRAVADKVGEIANAAKLQSPCIAQGALVVDGDQPWAAMRLDFRTRGERDAFAASGNAMIRAA